MGENDDSRYEYPLKDSGRAGLQNIFKVKQEVRLTMAADLVNILRKFIEDFDLSDDMPQH